MMSFVYCIYMVLGLALGTCSYCSQSSSPFVENSGLLRDREEHSTVGASIRSFGWHGCAVVGVTIVSAVLVASIFYGFDRMISDGKYTRNVVRELANQILARVDKNNVILVTITQVLQRHSDDHAILIDGQKTIMRELIEHRKGPNSQYVLQRTT